MLISWVIGIILRYIYYKIVLYFKYIHFLFANYTSIKMEKHVQILSPGYAHNRGSISFFFFFAESNLYNKLVVNLPLSFML